MRTAIVLIVIVLLIALAVSFTGKSETSLPQNDGLISDTASSTILATSTPGTTGTTTSTSTATSTTNVSTSSVRLYRLQEVATHNLKTDCWVAINGSVYNFTPWIAQHPGGADSIIGLCGKDGSGAYNAKHGKQQNPAKALAAFKIGELQK